MDFKLFTEFRKKKIDQKTWLLWKTYFPLMVQSKIFISILITSLQIFGRKFYKNTKNNLCTPKAFLIFIHKTPVVENHVTTREIRRVVLAQVDTYGNHCLFLHEQLAHLHAGNTQRKVSHIASDEDIVENNYIFVI